MKPIILAALLIVPACSSQAAGGAFKHVDGNNLQSEMRLDLDEVLNVKTGVTRLQVPNAINRCRGANAIQGRTKFDYIDWSAKNVDAVLITFRGDGKKMTCTSNTDGTGSTIK